MGQAPRDMIVRYTQRAFADRDALFAYWLERNPPKAEEIVRDIKHRVAELGGPLAQGHPTDKAGLGVLWVTPHPYLVFYRIEKRAVVVIKIRHTSQRPWGDEI